MNKTDKINKDIDKLQKKGNFKQAIETCRAAIAQDENNTNRHIKRGD